MVKHFLSNQQKKLSSQICRDLALFVASTFNRGQTIAQNIIHWEKSWITDNEILCHKEAKDYESWINNKDVTITV